MEELKKSPVGPSGLPQNERQLPYDIQRRLGQNPFYNGRLIDDEPAGDPDTPARAASEPFGLIKVPGLGTRHIPHQLGRKHSVAAIFTVRRDPSVTAASTSAMILNNTAGPQANWSASYVSPGGQVMIVVSASAYDSAGAGTNTLSLKIDGTTVASVVQVYNAANDHMPFPTIIYCGTLSKGTHTVSLAATGTNVVTDANDHANVTVYAGDALYEDRENTPRGLESTHVRIVNPSVAPAFFAMWVN